MSFAPVFNLSQDYLAARTRAQSLYWLITPKQFRDANCTYYRLADYYVKIALHTNESRGSKSSPDREWYIFLGALAKDTRDPRLLRNHMLNILLAGHDTTASLLSSVFYLLAHNPKVWAKLRSEIISKFGIIAEPKAEITFTSLKEVTYLRYVLDEGTCNNITPLM